MKIRLTVLTLAIVCCLFSFCPSGLADKAIDFDVFYLSIEGDCNLRSGPGLDYSILDVAAAGETLPFISDAEVDDRGVRWYLAEHGDVMGWVSSRYATLTNGVIPEVFYQADFEAPAYYELTEKNWLLSQPGSQGEVLATLFPGDIANNLRYYCFEDDAGWYYVIYRGMSGWISAEGTIGVMT